MASDQKPLPAVARPAYPAVPAAPAGDNGSGDSASGTEPPAPSRAEVQQRIDSLYQRVETATETYNATRVLAAKERQRSGAAAEAAKRSQWLDTARAKLGPSVPAVLPADRSSDRPAPGRSTGRPGAGRPQGLRQSSIDRTVAELIAATEKRRRSGTPALGAARETPALGPGTAGGSCRHCRRRGSRSRRARLSGRRGPRRRRRSASSPPRAVCCRSGPAEHVRHSRAHRPRGHRPSSSRPRGRPPCRSSPRDRGRRPVRT